MTNIAQRPRSNQKPPEIDWCGCYEWLDRLYREIRPEIEAGSIFHLGKIPRVYLKNYPPRIEVLLESRTPADKKYEKFREYLEWLAEKNQLRLKNGVESLPESLLRIMGFSESRAFTLKPYYERFRLII